ncbi:Cell division protein FtsI [Peptidoglycan synthetase] [hydrothermal vent metagenome]|uniref:Cell division protein FtsI [Peptidoglycan synthetase] n=1 Tax=hydrothermal vent metagenome TaxID=652676 RepID=A0A1W1D2R3_9ZZZZ
MVQNYKKKDSFYNHDYIEIVHFIPYKEIIPVYSKINLHENLKIVPSPKRFYPYGKIASHLIGYVSRANRKDIQKEPILGLIGSMGKTGIEKYYNSYLQGKVGERKIKVNASNEKIEELSYTASVENKKLTLTIDMELQQYIAKIFRGKVGTVIVMNVDGSILAASSFPNYDPNIFVNGMSYKMYNELASNPDHPFTNKFIHGLYPPGSVIKIGMGLIFISTEIDEKWTVYCKSNFPLGGRVFRCWKKYGHGKTDIVKAIRESCDDFFYKASLKVGNKKMSDGLLRYGLGAKTGVDLPNEFIGVVPSREWKRRKYNRPWNVGETLNTSIGQGDLLVTPLQIAQLTALIATGKLPTPHFAKLIGDKPYKPHYKDVLNDIEKKKLPIIQEAMYETCNKYPSTGKHFLSSNVIIAGKTGTAQVIGIKQNIKKRKHEHELDYYNRSHAWFTTYGPYKNPKYVVLAMVEHGGHGGHAAGKIISKIYNKLLELGYIDQKYNIKRKKR